MLHVVPRGGRLDYSSIGAASKLEFWKEALVAAPKILFSSRFSPGAQEDAGCGGVRRYLPRIRHCRPTSEDGFPITLTYIFLFFAFLPSSF